MRVTLHGKEKVELLMPQFHLAQNKVIWRKNKEPSGQSGQHLSSILVA